MFDGIKILIKDKATIASLINNPLFTLIGKHKDTGEEITPEDKAKDRRLAGKSANYQGFEVTVYEDSNTAILEGSLHYFFNEGIHNHNQYSILDLSHTLGRLQKELDLNPNTARIQNLEFGVNLCTPFSPSLFIKNLVTHKTNGFNNFRKGEGKRTLTFGKQYGLKIYNKGLQNCHLVTEDILRYEITCRKMELISKQPVYLSDLLKPAIIYKCTTLLQKAFKELIVKEPVLRKNLTSREREHYLNCINSAYWKTLNRNKRYEVKKQYNSLLNAHSTHPIKDITLTILNNTLLRLTKNTSKNNDVLTSVVTPLLRRSDPLKNVSNHLISSPIVRACKSCGRDITAQKETSIYCSEKLFGKEAKKCRNLASNPSNNFKRKLNKVLERGVLFNVLPFIRHDGNLHY